MGFRPLVSTPAGRVAASLAALIVVATVAGLAVMWPRGEVPVESDLAVGAVDRAQVTSVRGEQTCVDYMGPGCRVLTIELQSGANEGRETFVSLPGGGFAPPVDPGDAIRVSRNAPGGIDPGLAEELPLDDPTQQPYSFVDFERQSDLLWLAAGFALLVVGLGGLQGARALVALGCSLFLVVEFIVPAILGGQPPVLVAAVGALGVMLVTMGLTYGVGLKSVAAILGTAVALALTAGLALLTIDSANITGYSSEQATLLQADASLSLQGLVLAGIVVGALGVLDDVTVSQASTVLALRRANPAMPFRRLASDALRVGRDHLGATVNTLVLAYAGAALPILLIFATQQTGFGDAVNREPVAAEIVAMIVGSIGLIAAMPLTTLLASALAVRLPPEVIPEDDHGHVH